MRKRKISLFEQKNPKIFNEKFPRFSMKNSQDFQFYNYSCPLHRLFFEPYIIFAFRTIHRVTMQKILNYILLLHPILAITSCTSENEGPGEWIAILFVSISAAILFFVLQNKNRQKIKDRQEAAIKKALKDRCNFTESRVIKGTGDNIFYLAIDDVRKKVFYVFENQNLLFDFKDIVDVSIEEDGLIISSKRSILRSVAGGLIGEAAIGGAKGFFAGAAAFDKVKQQSQIKSMYVRVILINQRVDYFDIKCYDYGGGAESSHFIYSGNYNLSKQIAEGLFNIFQSIIDEADKEETENLFS